MAILTGAHRLEQRRRREETSEQSLIERCRRQDAVAFGMVVDAYQSRVFGFVRRMVRDVEDAEDVAQEVFIRAFQAFDRFDGRSSLRTWLFRIAYNLCVDRARRSDRQGLTQTIEGSDVDDEPIEFADHRWNPEQVSLTTELSLHVEDAIARMSEKLRTVLLLHDREDLTYEEIALAVSVPVGTVKSRLFLARAFLQDQLSGYLHEVSQ